MIKVLIADDHPLMLDGLMITFDDCDDIEVVGSASCGLKIVEYLERSPNSVDVVLTDIHMPGKSGLEIADMVANARRHQPKIILYSMYVDEFKVGQAIKKGVNGYLFKGCAGEEICDAVRIVYNEGKYFSKEVQQVAPRAKMLMNNLPTDREIEVAKLAYQGFQNKEIADKLGISTYTVDDHLKNLRKKFNASNRSELFSILREKGFF